MLGGRSWIGPWIFEFHVQWNSESINFCLVPWRSWIWPVVLLNWDVTSYYQNWASLKSPTDWSIQTEKFSSSLCQVMYNSTCSLNGPLKWSPKLDFKKPGQLIDSHSADFCVANSVSVRNSCCYISKEEIELHRKIQTR